MKQRPKQLSSLHPPTPAAKLAAKLAVCALILVTMLVYFPRYATYFVGDDYIQFDYIKEFVQRPYTAYQLFNPYHLPWYFRPIQNLWFLINRLILGYTAVGYYALQLSLHALTIALIYRVGRQLRLRPFAAFCGAALFAIHGHWLDVVSWISSMAIVTMAVINLLGVSAWLSYLRRPRTRQLLLTGGICLLALLTHEEGILLAPFLLLMLLVSRHAQIGQWRPLRRLMTPAELAFFGGLALLTVGYLLVQLTRPNLTIDLSEQTDSLWLNYVQPIRWYGFLLSTLYRYTLFDPIAGLSLGAGLVLVTAVLGLLALWFWRGDRIVRLGIIWWALHSAFIFAALYTQLPNLYAGRHIYNAALGLVFAAATSIDALLRRQRPGQVRRMQVGVGVAVTAVLLAHILVTAQVQETWRQDTLEEAQAEQQMKQLLPTITADQHFYSYRFPIAPKFTRAVMQLWYDTDLKRPGGDLEHLRTIGEAGPQDYLFDYADGRIYNLMPELQKVAYTYFLWAQPMKGTDAPALTLVQAANGPQLALPLPLEPAASDRLIWTTTIPAQTELHTAVLVQPGVQYRIHLQNDAHSSTYEITNPADDERPYWLAVTIPLSEFLGEETEIILEAENGGDTAVTAYFANPRLVEPMP